MSAPPILAAPGVRRVLVVDTSDGGEMQRDYFVFTVSEMTPALMLGNDKKRWSDSEMHGEDLHAPLAFLPLGNFARWLCQEDQEYWRDPGVTKETRPMVETVLSLIEAEPRNENILGAISPPEASGSIAAFLKPPGDDASGPEQVVEIAIEANSIGLDKFNKWFGRRTKANEKARVAKQCADLRASLGAAVEKTRAAYNDRNEVREKMRPYLQKFQLGLAVLDICIDFGKTPEERRKLWPGWEFADRAYVTPPPDEKWRKRAVVLRKSWERDLLGGCARVVNSSFSQQRIDAAANVIVNELRRPGAAYLRMLDEWESLCAGAQAELSATLDAAFELGLRSGPSRERLLDGEIGTLARQASMLTNPAGPEGTDATSIGIRRALATFDTDAFPALDETPFGQVLVDRYDSADALLAHDGLLCRILSKSATYVISRLRRETFLPIAWAFRTLDPLVGPPKAARGELWRLVKRMCSLSVSANEKKRVWDELLDWRKGLLSESYRRSVAAWGVVRVFTRLLVVHYANEALEGQPDSLEKKLEFYGGIADLLDTTLSLVAGREASDLLIDVVEDSKGTSHVPNIVVAAGIITDAMSFAISLEKYWSAAGGRKSEKTVQRAREDAVLDFASLALSLAIAATGTGFVVVALAITGTKTFVGDLDNWMPKISSEIESKPAPHVFLEGLLRDVLDDGVFPNLMTAYAAHGGGDLQINAADKLRDLEAPPMKSTRLLWDLGGPKRKHKNLDITAQNFIRVHWSLPREIANVIVEPCDDE
jgi:hypothetical protein